MADHPFVSVILPVRNEEQFIARCLDSILSQSYPKEAMEIIVADGESDDATVEIIKALPGAERVRIVSNPGRTQAAGLNCLIAHARGDIILRVDGHAVIAQDYVSQSVRALQETGAAFVGGCLTPMGVTPMGRAIAAAMTSRFGIPSAYHVATQPQYTDMIYLGAWPRAVFEQVGGYDERLPPNEDYEFIYRVRKHVGPVYLTQTIRSAYYGRQSLAPLIRQFFNYGRAKTGTLRQHPTSVKPRQLVPVLFVAALVVGAALAIPFLWARIGLLATLLLYAVVNLGFSVGATVRQHLGLGEFLRLPMIFFLLHVTWGAGFWFGMVFGSPHARATLGGPPTWAQLRAMQTINVP